MSYPYGSGGYPQQQGGPPPQYPSNAYGAPSAPYMGTNMGYPQQPVQPGYPAQGGYVPPPPNYNAPVAPGFAPAPGYGMAPGQGYGAPGQVPYGAPGQPMMGAPGYPMAPGMVPGQHHGGHHGIGIPLGTAGLGAVAGAGGQPPTMGFPTADLGQQTNSWAPNPNYGPQYGNAPPSQGGAGMYPSVGMVQPNVQMGAPYGSAPNPSQGYGGMPSAAPAYGSAAPGYPGGAPPAQGYNVQGTPMAPALSGVASEYERMKQYGNTPRGTLRPFPGFNAEADSKVLRKAMKGIGTDENAIISVVCYRTNAQRQEIKRVFKVQFGKDLISEFESEVGGNFRAALIALFSPMTYYDAWSLHQATQGVGTKEGALIEILCTRTNQEIREIVRMYKSEFHRDLEADIAHDTSGCFRRLLVSACQASRNELTDAQWQRVFAEGPACVVDRARAQQDAHALLQAGEAKWGTDESCFNEIMALRNHFQLRATFEEYARIAGRDIMATIEREFSGDIKDGFLALVKVAQCRPLYFAERLHHAMKGAGTNDSALIRVIVSRAEIDLADIKRCYAEKYHTALAAAIQSETSGDYKHLLLAIIGRD